MKMKSVKNCTVVLVVVIVLVAMCWFIRDQGVVDQIDIEVARLDQHATIEIKDCNESMVSSELRVATYEDNFSNNDLTLQVDRNESIEALNLTHPEICVDQWRNEIIGLEEALRCIDTYIEQTK